MRITSANAYDSAVGNLQRRQSALTEAQEKLTSGKRVLKPSDDPVAAAQAERALATVARSEAQMRALDVSRHSMQLSESALGQAGELVQQARDLLVSAGNGSYTAAERRNIAESIKALRQDLLGVANRSDGAGRYLFGGQGADGPPLLDGPGGVSYNAAPGQLNAAAGEASPLSIDGRLAWLEAPDPSSPGSTLSIFDVMDRVVGELTTPGATSADVALTVSRGLGEFDAGAQNLSAWRSRTGESLRRIDAIAERLGQTQVDAQRDRSDAEDLDMVQAISDFQNQQTGYDAALKTYSIVQQMSLLQYLR